MEMFWLEISNNQSYKSANKTHEDSDLSHFLCLALYKKIHSVVLVPQLVVE